MPSSSEGAAARTAGSPRAPEGDDRRHAGGIALVVGAALLVALIETGTVAYSWLPLLTGLTYLAAAVARRSRGPLWGPGLVVSTVGLAAGLWLQDGRTADSFQLLALAVMALGLGGVLAALLGQVRGVTVSAMSIAMPVLLFGAFSLLEQRAVEPFAGRSWVYGALLAVWGAYELRPARTR